MPARDNAYNPEEHHRRSIRLEGYDYSSVGAYFVTTCVHNRACLFGRVSHGEMHLSSLGRTVQGALQEVCRHYVGAALDAFVIMPNHVHVILILKDGESSGQSRICPEVGTKQKRRHGVSEIVRAFKAYSARRANLLLGTPKVPLWQRNYFEHIVRDEGSLDKIRDYIADNPVQWQADRENPEAIPPPIRPFPWQV